MEHHSRLPSPLIERLKARAGSSAPTDESIPGTDGLRAAPLSASLFDEAAERLGLQLPLAMRQLWGEVANGGFGPGYGITGLIGGHSSDPSGDIVTHYLGLSIDDPHDEKWRWPARMIPFCNWGCAIHSCIDISTSELRVFRFDPNGVDSDWRAAWFDESHTLESWLHAWLDDVEIWMSDGISAVDDDFDIARQRSND